MHTIETKILNELAVADISPWYPIFLVNTAETVDKGAQYAIIIICLASNGIGRNNVNKETTIVPTILKPRILKTFLASNGETFISNIKPIINIARKLLPAPIVEAIVKIGEGICSLKIAKIKIKT